MISLNSFHNAPEARSPESGPHGTQPPPLDVGFMSKPYADLTPRDRENLWDYQEQIRALEFQAVEDIATALKGGMPHLPTSLCFLAAQYAVRNDRETLDEIQSDPVFKLLERASDQTFGHLLLDLAASHLKSEHSTLPRKKPENMPDQKAWDVLEMHRQYLLNVFHDSASLDPGEATLKLRLHTRVFPPRHQQSNPWWVMAATVGILLQWVEEEMTNKAGLPKALAYSPRCAAALNQLRARWKAGAATFEEVEREHDKHVAAHSERLMHRLCRALSLQMHAPLLDDKASLTPRPKTSYELTQRLKEAGYRNLGSALSWGNETPDLFTKAHDLFLPVVREWLSATGHNEIHVCHHLKFYFTVESD